MAAPNSYVSIKGGKDPRIDWLRCGLSVTSRFTSLSGRVEVRMLMMQLNDVNDHCRAELGGESTSRHCFEVGVTLRYAVADPPSAMGCDAGVYCLLRLSFVAYQVMASALCPSAIILASMRVRSFGLSSDPDNFYLLRAGHFTCLCTSEDMNKNIGSAGFPNVFRVSNLD